MSDGRYRYAIIGTGRPHGSDGATGFGMAHTHYPNFMMSGRVDLVAVSDLDCSLAEFFLEKNGASAKIYTDYKEMLAVEKPDILSICTWPHLHAEMTVAAAEAGVRAIHCEKPMATTWGDAKRMKAAADKHGALLTFNHQRRHIKLFQAVRQAVVDGEIGDLVMIEAECGDMLDWGTHWLDMLQMYNGDCGIEWVMGQIESHTEKRIFGAFMENQAIVHYKWKNGVRGVFISGEDAKIGCVHRLIGTEGVIEVMSERKMRIRGKGDSEWRYVEVAQGPIHDFTLACMDVVRQLDEPGYVSILTANNAIQHTEIIYATYESSRRRGRIDLPLKIEDSPLLAMVAAGEIGPDRTK